MHTTSGISAGWLLTLCISELTYQARVFHQSSYSQSVCIHNALTTIFVSNSAFISLLHFILESSYNICEKLNESSYAVDPHILSLCVVSGSLWSGAVVNECCIKGSILATALQGHPSAACGRGWRAEEHMFTTRSALKHPRALHAYQSQQPHTASGNRLEEEMEKGRGERQEGGIRNEDED